ncbi:glycosyl transferase [Pseudomonas endophytica]|uniref:Glycosyl transferase n=1 Tax=Pseudomonas endophytica TaxID=1563157 RepID=A0A0Q0YZV9_9PSED|nr:glycosyltransferase family 4 protein [Pseudomonas endophytica]KQB55350.1 glycosyl transferase [Pseudomonas endophytica]
MNYLILLAPAAAILALLLTGLLRRYAIARSIIDVPTERSSHSVPTPRGGGVGIVLSFLVMLPLLSMWDIISNNILWGFFGAGSLVALIGFLDDHGHIAARWRLLGHFSAAAWILYWFGGFPSINIFGMTIYLSWLGHLLAAFFLVWMLNLYNFMDGIDGLASVEAVSSCLSASFIYWLVGYSDLAGMPVILSMSVLGFLFWNFPPARIFMGDAGSGFLGIILAGFSIQAAWHDTNLLWIWLILLGVFIVDATLTLFRRFISGCKVYEAHRSHAYQFASRKVGSHLPVTFSILAINIFWLLPIALCVALLGLNGLIGLLVAYVPLVFLAFKYHAGESELSASSR